MPVKQNNSASSLQRIVRVWRVSKPDGPAANFSYERIVDDSENTIQVPTKVKRFKSKLSWRPRYRLRISGLRRLLKRRSRLMTTLRVSCSRLYERLKESHVHFTDLFAGNYLLLQVTPPPIFYRYEKPAMKVLPGYAHGFSHDPMCHTSVGGRR